MDNRLEQVKQRLTELTGQLIAAATEGRDPDPKVMEEYNALMMEGAERMRANVLEGLRGTNKNTT